MGRAGSHTRLQAAISFRGTRSPLSSRFPIDVSYDRTSLFQDDIATATATVRNNLGKAAKMVILDLGIPPGFELFSEDLQDYQDMGAGLRSGHLSKFSITAPGQISHPCQDFEVEGL